MECKSCGLRLFDCDIVDSDLDIYRCPRCFEIRDNYSIKLNEEVLK